MFESKTYVNSTKKFVESISTLNGAFNCEWNDEIHDSYGRYVQFFSKRKDNFEKYAKTITQSVNRLNSLRINETNLEALAFLAELEGAINE